ncbi:hypothetical protein BV25DRAFT_1829898 [Artomyces pyxidatus]|uniref:Uncharacterized protein n=1 Tax=Artomyces pyxidatus TaxID=48021 RepID=A0ACB8SRE0_9AGAM|nr:hypothetical protein BV25DRAFT_1829898 [Artomyces pyxidatus]
MSLGDNQLQPMTGPLLNVCAVSGQTGDWSAVEDMLYSYWPTRNATLDAYLRANVNWLGKPSAWGPLHQVHPLGVAFHRLGLNMSAIRFSLAKSLLKTIIERSRGFSLDSLFSVPLSPYFILYACMDLDLPLPTGFDMRFLWTHLSDLVDKGRTGDLVHEGAPIQEISDGLLNPSTDLVDHVGDPEGIIQLLYLRFYPGARPIKANSSPKIFTVFVAADSACTAGYYPVPGAKARGVVEKTFSLRHESSAPAFASSREIYAMLDAACCWGPLWMGCTVRFPLSSIRLVWAVNDAIVSYKEFPAVAFLLAFATRWNFKIEATFYDPVKSMRGINVARNLAARGKDSFSPDTGLGLELMDSVVMSCFGRTEFGEDFQEVVLAKYLEILRLEKAEGYVDPLVRHNIAYTALPGKLYFAMRSKQIMAPMALPIFSLSQDTTKTIPDPLVAEVFGRKIIEAPAKQNLWEAEAIDLEEPAFDSVPSPPVNSKKASHRRSVEAAAAAALRARKSVKAMLLRERGSDRVQQRVRRAEGSSVRISAAHDFSGRLAKRDPEIHFWQGSPPL